jgi:hypothetical protein
VLRHRGKSIIIIIIIIIKAITKTIPAIITT